MGEELGQLEKLKIDAVVNEDFAVKKITLFIVPGS